MKAYYLSCEFDFQGANLCSNSGVYRSRERALEVLFPSGESGHYKTIAELEKAGIFEIAEIEIE